LIVAYTQKSKNLKMVKSRNKFCLRSFILFRHFYLLFICCLSVFVRLQKGGKYCGKAMLSNAEGTLVSSFKFQEENH